MAAKYEMLAIVARQDRKWGVYGYGICCSRELLFPANESYSTAVRQLIAVAEREGMEFYELPDGQLRARPMEAAA